MQQLLCAGFACLALVRVAAAEEGGLKPADIFELQQVSSPALSPDARRLAYRLTRRDITTDTKIATTLLSIDGGPGIPLAPAGCGAARWASDSRRIAFVCHRDKLTSIDVLDTVTHERTVLAESSAPILDFAWSRAAAEIAFVKFVADDQPPITHSSDIAPPGARWSTPFRRPITRLSFQSDGQGDLGAGTYQTFIVPAQGGAPRQITTGQWWTGGFGGGPDLAWSADDREVLLSATRAADWDINLRVRKVHGVRVADGAVREVAGTAVAQGDVAVSPDGRWVAYTAEVDFDARSVRNRRVYLAPLNGGPIRCISSALDRSVDQLAWRDDGKALIVSYEDLGSRVVASIAIDGRVTVLARDLGGEAIEYPSSPARFSVARNGTIAYVRSTSSVPGVLMLREPNGRERAVTRLNDGLAARVGGFVAAEPIWVKSSVDRERVQAWLIRAKGAGADTPKPLILDIHGGPDSQYGDRFSIRYQLFASAGFNVVYGNARGSTGYGERFANLNHNDWPGHDTEDLMDIVRAALQRDFVDAKKVFVTGISAGGTMSLWLTAQTDLFSASVAIKPLTDWTSWILTSDIGPQLYNRWMGGALPWTDQAAYWRRSPLSLVARIKTPTMLISGDDDLRAAPGQSHEMYVALKLAGVDAAWVRGPNVSHNSYDYTPSLFLQDFEYTRWWFETHLPGAAPQRGTGGGVN